MLNVRTSRHSTYSEGRAEGLRFFHGWPTDPDHFDLHILLGMSELKVLKNAALSVSRLVCLGVLLSLGSCVGNISDMSESDIQSRYHVTTEHFLKSMLQGKGGPQVKEGPVRIARVSNDGTGGMNWESFGAVQRCGASLCYRTVNGKREPMTPRYTSGGALFGYQTGGAPHVLFGNSSTLFIGRPGQYSLAMWNQGQFKQADLAELFQLLNEAIRTSLQVQADHNAQVRFDRGLATGAQMMTGLASSLNGAPGGGGGGDEPKCWPKEISCDHRDGQCLAKQASMPRCGY